MDDIRTELKEIVARKEATKLDAIQKTNHKHIAFLEKEVSRLETLLDSKEAHWEKAFMDYIANPGTETAMHDWWFYEHSKMPHQAFCNDICPISNCMCDCFKKERAEALQSREVV